MGTEAVQDNDVSTKIRVAEMKAKVSGKYIGKGQRMVFRDVGWEW